ncbi:FHA domain-containing protein [Kamptonema sp. UHCC 0994]|uniref:FHA domain-containing protein n=1 Tax=Kamptonema sp. UHCC 0994 TaxID=3031329 RepID=UPI0023B8E319|nr:FHA domain-containing protein [Kamptonema sp. UHCC 0994]MDF0552306.1 FHA domain-containing protein [Kamptonema sp. UHCC 0994]
MNKFVNRDRTFIEKPGFYQYLVFTNNREENHRTISRYHCLLDINPPDIRVRDFGSKNGTFVNGKKIGQRQANQTPEEGANYEWRLHGNAVFYAAPTSA